MSAAESVTDTSDDRPIEIRGLDVTLDGRPVLQSVDLSVEQGASLVLIGPSAAGKSVLLKTLLGLIEPDRGAIRITGKDPAALPSRERDLLYARVGVLFQRNALFDSLPVWRNVAFRGLQGGSMTDEEAREQALVLIERVGLDPSTADLLPAELSGGMQKRVAVARAVMGEPDILLLDDPTAGLDPVLTRSIFEMISELLDHQHITAITVTADMSAAERFFDELALLHEGRMIWRGAASEARSAADPHVVQMLDGSRDGPIQMRLEA